MTRLIWKKRNSSVIGWPLWIPEGDRPGYARQELIRRLASDSVVEFATESTVSNSALQRLPGVKECEAIRGDPGSRPPLDGSIQDTLSGLMTWAGEAGVTLKDLRPGRRLWRMCSSSGRERG